MKELKNFNSLNNNKLLVIVPINKVEDFLLNECLYSLAQQDYSVDVLLLTKGLSPEDNAMVDKIASSPKVTITSRNDKGEVSKDDIHAIRDLNFKLVETESDTFQKIFNESLNYAIANKYEWFSVVEADDVVDVKWYHNFSVYEKAKGNVDGFVPLTREISNGVFTGFFNEACWVEGLAETAGYFDLSLLTRFSCMNVTGTVFKTESIKRFSIVTKKQIADTETDYYTVMKESLKVEYIYEFVLRMIYKDLKFFSVPRVGYEHRIDRPTPVVDYFTSKLPRDIVGRPEIAGGLTPDEHTFWKNLVKKEYWHDKDRQLTYVKK